MFNKSAQFRGLCLAVLSLVAATGGAQTTASNPQVKVGKYVVELRLPAEGIYSGEEIDLEFRVLDSTTDDPVLGLAGVPNCVVSALVTMPSMQGMPPAKPPTHREGVPGDYGLTTYFPHGGEFRIDLVITPPTPAGGTPTSFKATFMVDVKDERPTGKPAPKPYALTVKLASPVQAGKPSKVVLSVIDSRTKKIVKDFDVAHTMRFHLLLASQDFGWFLHEHPIQEPDGTWSVDVTFPAGGTFFVYGDVAPSGQGSLILGNKIPVSGPASTWPKTWALNKGPSSDGGVTGILSGLQQEIPVGRSVTLKVNLKDDAGQPISDLEPWLGANGHLMIFSQDGQTVVHSHPFEGEDADRLAKKGEIHFNARFPKPGKYRAFAQIQRGGQVKTLSFTLEVKP